MGCINSKNELNDKNRNIFHVINVDDDGTALWSGQLEVTRTELTLHRKGKEPTYWPLRCLRRYGYNADQFTFEAGRRCLTGQGIYAFKCRRAEDLFYTVQSYIQGRVNLDNTIVNNSFPITLTSSSSVPPQHSTVGHTNRHSLSSQINAGLPQEPGSYVINRPGMTTSQSLSPNGTIHSISNQSRSTDTLPNDGSYVDPSAVRIAQPAQTITTRFSQGLRLSSVSSSGPLSPDITSPGSPNSITNILEVTTLNPLPNSNTNNNHHGVSNLYQEFPVKESLISTINRMSLDIPPQEPPPAPIQQMNPGVESQIQTPASTTTLPPISDVSPMTPANTPDYEAASHMYMNVNIATSKEFSAHQPIVTSRSTSKGNLINSCSFEESQYQNVKTPTTTGGVYPFLRMNSAFSIDPNRCYENLEPTQIRGRYSKPDIFAKVDLPMDKSDPSTPTTTNRKVNYIVLDLDQTNAAMVINVNGLTSPTATNVANIVNNNVAAGSNSTVTTPNSLLSPESPHKASQGYATIDFNKTVALSNSTTPSSELDSEGSRKTRHNSTVVPSVLPLGI